MMKQDKAMTTQRLLLELRLEYLKLLGLGELLRASSFGAEAESLGQDGAEGVGLILLDLAKKIRRIGRKLEENEKDVGPT